jgi:hypothetical protein
MRGKAQGPTKSGKQLSLQTSSAGPGRDCPDQDGDSSSRTLLTVLTVETVFATVVCILMTLLPARPSRPKAMSMPRARRNVCARRRRPASARGFLGQPALSPDMPLLRPAPVRRRSAALPVHELRSAMMSRAQAATGSASITRSRPCDWRRRRERLAPQLALRTSLRLANGRQGQKNGPVAEIRPADHLLDPIQEDRARRFKQHLLVIRIELPYGEAAAGREQAQRVGEPNRQAGQVVEGEQVAVIGCVPLTKPSTRLSGTLRMLLWPSSASSVWLLLDFAPQFNESSDCFSTRGEVALAAAPVVYDPQKLLRYPHLKQAILGTLRWAATGPVDDHFCNFCIDINSSEA